MCTNPLVTIITVCYNSEKTICNTIESVLNQTYKNIEYIIIDGNSNDNTVNLIKKYETLFLDRNIKYKWISEKDEGIYYAMNKGIDLATGKWINFMNSDDTFFNKNVIKDIFYNNKNIFGDILYGKVQIVGKGCRHIQNCSKIEYIWKGMPFCHQSSFVKANLLKKYKFNIKYTVAAEFCFYIDMYLKHSKFQKFKNIISIFNSYGYSFLNKKKYISEMKEIVLSHKEFKTIRIYYYYILLEYITNIAIQK